MPPFDPRRRRFRLPLSQAGVSSEIDDEIAFHIEERVEDLIARGMSPDEARAQALTEFGDIGVARSELVAIGQRRVRDKQRAGWWSDLAQDLRYGLRGAVRAPLFSLVAIITLALGIGANAALFAVVKPVMVDPLPYAEPGRLVRLFGHNIEVGDDRWGMSAGMVADIAELERSFSDLAAFTFFPTDVMIGDADNVQMASAAVVQPSYLRVLGVQPMLGRPFNEDDLPSEGLTTVVIVSHAAWQRVLGGRTDVIGQQVVVNDRARTVVGVLPRGFVAPHGDADFYFPLNLAPILADPVAVRRTYNLGLIARLAPTVNVDAAQHDMTAAAAAIQREHPDDIRGIGIEVVPLRTAMVGDTRTPLLVLMAGAILVLLIACANLAGAMLARVISRRHEFGIRVSLGASRGRLVRQVLTESMILAVAGGLAGVLLGSALLLILRDLALPALPHFADMALDGGVMLTVAAVTLAAGVAIGLLPSLMIGREQVVTEQTRSASEGRATVRLRGLLVSAQIALCLALVVSAGLLSRSLWLMSTAPTGIDERGVVTATLSLPPSRYGSPAQIQAFHETLIERLQALTGADDVATASELPRGIQWSNSFVIEGAPWGATEAEPFVLMQTISDDYFRTLRIPLLQGRAFDARDHADAPRSIIISETMARRYWPDGNALGARIRIGPDVESEWWQVIAVVGDVRNDPARDTADPITYASYRQITPNILAILARAQGSPTPLLAALESELTVIDPSVSVQGPLLLERALARGLDAQRLPVVLMVSFGLLALLLASIGVYAMFATMVAAREREFGVRMAIGAAPGAIARHVVQQGSRWMALGLVIGTLATVVAAYSLRGLLFGVSPFDPATLSVAAAVLAACAALALLPPLLRAMRVDPAVIMRAE